MKFIASLILIFLGCFTGTALAADVASDPAVSETISKVFDAIVHGQYWPALCAAVVLLCALEIRYAPESWKSGAKGRLIGTAVAFTASFATTLGAALAAPGSMFTSAVAMTALKVGVGAIGGYNAISALVDWLLTFEKMPAWAKTVLNMINAIIGRNTVKKAEDAGAAAVAANPPPGMAPGAIREID